MKVLYKTIGLLSTAFLTISIKKTDFEWTKIYIQALNLQIKQSTAIQSKTIKIILITNLKISAQVNKATSIEIKYIQTKMLRSAHFKTHSHFKRTTPFTSQASNRTIINKALSY